MFYTLLGPCICKVALMPVSLVVTVAAIVTVAAAATATKALTAVATVIVEAAMPFWLGPCICKVASMPAMPTGSNDSGSSN